mgnify:CR=1 FL=1
MAKPRQTSTLMEGLNYRYRKPVMRAVVLMLTLLLCSSALSDPALGRPSDELSFAIISDVPSTGLAVRLLSAAYKELDITIATREVPSRRTLMMADIGEVDGDLFRIASVAEQYPNLVRVPHRLLHGQLHVATSRPGFTGLQNLGETETADLRVAVRRGVIVAEQAAQALGMELVRADSYGQMHALLEWRRVDVALVSDIEGLSPMHDESWDPFYVFPEPVVHFPLYHYLHRRHAELAEPLAQVLEMMERNGERARILSGYQTLPNDL